MNILFFDTETSGLPPRGGHWKSDHAKWPHIASVAWRLVDEGTKRCLIEQHHLIRPDGWEMPKEASDINGLTMDKLKARGTDIKTVLRHFMMDALTAQRLVAHNIYFDTSMVKSGLLKLGVHEKHFLSTLDKSKRYCTMYKATDIISSKWPKLEEIYDHFFHESFETHVAIHDVRACERVYHELIERGIK